MVPSPYYRYIPRKAIGALSALTLCGILVAGLWPFHSPRNQVHWLGNQNGLRFDRYGTLLSSRHFEVAKSAAPSCSVELWLKPARTWGIGTVLTFYNPLNGRQFSLRQDYIDLVLQRDIGDGSHQTNLNVDDVFRRKQAFITVTSDGQDTAVYIDGNLVTRSLQLGLSVGDLAGQLIVANSPLQSNSWAGRLGGLAIYNSELTAEQIAQHYEDWTRKGKPTFADDERALALYLFDERTGRIIHNRVPSGIDLYIPERFMVVHQTLLELPWSEFQTQKSYLKNALINIGGFVPLGFSVCAYLSLVRRLRRPAVATVIVGVMFSVTIEVLQAYLPTRDSGMTDIITNTLGACVGVMLYHATAVPLARIGRKTLGPGTPGYSPEPGQPIEGYR